MMACACWGVTPLTFIRSMLRSMRMTTVGQSAGTMTFTYLRRSADPSLHYSYMQSEDLDQWSPFTPETGPVETVSELAGFVRVTLTLPPAQTPNPKFFRVEAASASAP